ncbi:MAG: hypothetical protein V4568_02250 [Pseudomonadota bacterium]
MGNVALIAEQLASQTLRHRLPIIGIASSEFHRQQFASVINNQRDVKTEKPSSENFTAPDNISEQAMGMNAMGIADFQIG